MRNTNFDFMKEQDYTVLDFNPKALPPSLGETELIVNAAMQAPSARNKQAYWLTAVRDYDTQMEMSMDQFGNCRPQPSTILLVWSRPESGELNRVDIGLSMAYASLMADSLNFGSHIYSSTPRKLAEAGDYEKYGIPSGYIPTEYMLVGKAAYVDGVSQATKGERADHFNIV